MKKNKVHVFTAVVNSLKISSNNVIVNSTRLLFLFVFDISRLKNTCSATDNSFTIVLVRIPCSNCYLQNVDKQLPVNCLYIVDSNLTIPVKWWQLKSTQPKQRTIDFASAKQRESKYSSIFAVESKRSKRSFYENTSARKVLWIVALRIGVRCVLVKRKTRKKKIQNKNNKSN